MSRITPRVVALALGLATGLGHIACSAGPFDEFKGVGNTIQLGPRPGFLVDDMADGPLKDKLQSCANRALRKVPFSIGHRGAALQFPEHTLESYVAAARMGAGVVECDVTFTKDQALVCRHSQCDLHTTTNIVDTPLGAQCTRPFTPAIFNANGSLATPAAATCCTSDITLAQFKTLRGKMDAFNPAARTQERVSGWDRQLPHRSLRGTDQRHPADPRREHRVVQGTAGEDDAGAQERERGDALQWLHPGGLRTATDRRIPRRRGARAGCLSAILRHPRHPLLDRQRTGFRQAGRLPGRRRGRGRPAQRRRTARLEGRGHSTSSPRRPSPC